jgi:hypothetical protein
MQETAKSITRRVGRGRRCRSKVRPSNAVVWRLAIAIIFRWPMALDDPRDDTVLETLAFTAVGGVLVLCHTSADPSDDEWETWIDRERRHEHRAILIATRGGAPNSRQRARVAEATGQKSGRRPPVALLTDSAVTRSVMTAFGWILGAHAPMKAFPTTALEEAVSWLAVTVRPETVRAVMARLQASLLKGVPPRSTR